MKLVLDNIIFSLQKAGGASVYWTNLMEAFSRREGIDLRFVERNDAMNNLFRQKVDMPSQASSDKDAFLRFDQFSSPSVDDDAIFHSSCYRVARGVEVVNVTTVYDFIGEYYFSGPLKWIHDGQIRSAVRRSDALICISESTRLDLLKFVPEASKVPIEVIHLSYDDVGYTYKPTPRKNQVVFIGSRVGYKNFELALRSVAACKGVSLLIIGAPLSKDEERLASTLLPGRFEVQSYPSTDKVCSLFRESMALLYLSEYEGFGLPVLEAMASGLPVIALNRSSIPEVAGEAGILLDGARYELVASSIALLMNDRDIFDEQVAMGLERVKRFSWSRCADETYAFYEHLRASAKR
ncbi:MULTISPECIES: glycosyltransferase family 4 protein [Gordonibacter]|uniref:glycosyltransferase family 4 protein n=1 Tax=Gordonibacter TaxID=644652 RepID=UPI001D063262|nr:MULTISPECIES: glycosyltransferase family 1 protein [Gordonibacter]MCB6312904.1 glycosyltransferase family 4 protein [Gordonibacter pamelaeae]MCB6561727.1 glycosyltransferase family 4 protein [Gordonibacter urolithinfaciens]MCB7085718.1 glycosyltransferase family 4 protein [Gordonibacter urolithinfaciens]